jgi:hypothetical protein
MTRALGFRHGTLRNTLGLGLLATLAGAGCGDDPEPKRGSFVVTGRVFSSDQELAIAGARVSGTGDETTTGSDGSFELALTASQGAVHATSKNTAPVSKAARSR